MLMDSMQVQGLQMTLANNDIYKKYNLHMSANEWQTRGRKARMIKRKGWQEKWN